MIASRPNWFMRTTLLCLFVQTILCSYETSLFKGNKDEYGSIPSKISIPSIEKEWANGNAEAGAELGFAFALGAGVDQDLHKAIEQSTSLLAQEAARAYTTLGLLFSHNLTGIELNKSERENKSMEHYITAASLGDPLAQMIVAEKYYKMGSCLDAVNYFRKTSSYLIKNTMEMHISKPTYVRHIWDEDNVIPAEAFPNEDQLHYFEHLSSGEPEAALQAAALLLSGVNDIDKDLDKVEKYLRKAIEGNITTAMIWLAQLQLRDLISGDGNETLMLLEQALEYGDELAHSGIGRIHMEGLVGMEKNLSKAEYHLQKGMDAGNMDSYYQLGKLYMMKDRLGSADEAAQLWIIPAALGHVNAAWSLAEHYRNLYLESSYRSLFSSSFTTALLPKMCDVVFYLYRTVAQAGEYFDLFDEAYTDYYAGRKGAALMKYLLLSDLGYSAGHVNAARMLDEGVASVYESDTSSRGKAFEMWNRAVNSGISKGSVRIGDYYYYGLGGKEINYTAAVQHYTKAYTLGDPEGGFSLAYATEWGQGIQQNFEKAEKLYYEIIKYHPEALMPSAITLIRLKTFVFLKNTFHFNIYPYFSWNLDVIFTYVNKVLSNLLVWDYILILLLTIFVSIKLVYRR